MKRKTTGFLLTCDNCGQQYETAEGYASFTHDPDGGQIEQAADSGGWLIMGGRHYCPECWKRESGGMVRTKDGRLWDWDTEEEVMI